MEHRGVRNLEAERHGLGLRAFEKQDDGSQGGLSRRNTLGEIQRITGEHKVFLQVSYHHIIYQHHIIVSFPYSIIGERHGGLEVLPYGYNAQESKFLLPVPNIHSIR